MSYMQLTKTYGNAFSTQNYNQITTITKITIAALLQKWKRKKVRNLSVGPALKTIIG
jgi:hypothetical protein